MQPSPEQISRVAELYEHGLYLQAYRAALAVGPLDEWEGAPGRTIAGRLASNLGAPELARRLHLRAWRGDRASAEACYYFALTLNQYRGPLAAWRFVRRQGDLSHAAPPLQAEWLALGATALGALRDFDAAEERLAQAERLDPLNTWVAVERAHLCELEDRYEDALRAARRALDVRPWYRPAVQSAAHLLVLLGRDDEALALLGEAAQRLESAWVLAEMAEIQSEHGRFEDARRSLERFAELAPLLEADGVKWLNSRRSDIAYLSGDLDAALRYARLSDQPFYHQIVERLERRPAPGEEAPRRVMLPVGFVRQHHMTCAPATLSAISRYWRMPADHLGIVEEICYDGTPAHSERHWAERQGWAVREFSVNWDDAARLLDRGVAFTLTTVDPGNAHLQAVIGYDSRRGTLIVRDPYLRHWSELRAEEGLKHYAASGPRGMALVPAAESALLADLQLKEAPLYDQLYAVQQALMAHDRERAEGVIEGMKREADGHRLTLLAELSVASYDDDGVRVLACFDRLTALFPDDANWQLARLSCLQRLARRGERLEALAAICAKKDADPLFCQQYAEELSDDAREHARAAQLLRRAARLRPTDARNFHLRANLLWAARRFDEALELYRFAACLKDTDEQYVRSYFIAARHFRQTDAALAFLESRFARFGRRSGSPVRTLAWAYEQTGQDARALAALKSGVELRPDDGALLLNAADAFARNGDFDEAAQLIARAEGKAARTEILRAAAAIAAYRGDLPTALAEWRRVAEAEPLAADANRSVARLLAETEGREAAVAFLRRAVARFPHSVALHQILIEWLRDDAVAAEEAVRRLIEVDPLDAWAHRELAISLTKQRRFDEAFAAVEQAGKLEPASPSYHSTRGKIHLDVGRVAEAKAAFQEAIRLSVDDEYSIAMLLAASPTPAEKRAALRFVKEELVRQVTFGEGLTAYREAARGVLEPEELRTLLAAALDARPDLWHAWSALVCQLIDMARLDEALALAEQFAARFPLVPRAWYDLAAVHRARLSRGEAVAALRRALDIAPGWSLAVQQLAEAHQHAGEFEEGRELLERAVVRDPLDSCNYGYLADLLWKMGEREQALERVRHALALDPGYGWGWHMLRDWAHELQRPEAAAECARELAAKRPGEARSWLTLARVLNRPGDLAERLGALDRAVALNPRLIDAYALRASLLAGARRFDEARAACRPDIFGDELPLELRSAAAWVEAEQGRVEEAIKQIRAIVAGEPNYYEGWSHLADWYRANGPTESYVEAAEALARIAPQQALAWGYVGDARLASGDREGAKEALRRAAALAPDYEFAAGKLFELQLADEELDDAARTLEVIRRQVGGDAALLSELQLHARLGDQAAARAALGRLCASPTAGRSHFDAAAAAMSEKLWGDAADEVLGKALYEPGANACAGELWAERCAARGAWAECEARLAPLPKGGEMWRRAFVTYLEALAKAGLKHRARQGIKSHRAELRADVKTWGGVGYVLLTLGDRREVTKWLGDWRQYAGRHSPESSQSSLEPWMLWNYVLALGDLKRGREAYEAGSAALALPADHTSDSHRLLLACADALAGDADAARGRLQEVAAQSLSEWDRFVYEVASALLDSGAGPEGEVEGLRRLADAAKAHAFYRESELLFSLYARALRRVAARSGSLAVKAAACGHLLWAYVRKAVAAQAAN
jgi:cellulose synthase operon protein C